MVYERVMKSYRAPEIGRERETNANISNASNNRNFSKGEGGKKKLVSNTEADQG